MIDYNIRNQIKLFRISSDIIPFGSHPVNGIPWWEEYKEQFNAIGEKIKGGKLRVSMHPGQYTVLNSPDEAVVRRSMEDLIYHDRFLDALGLDQKSKMVLHIGGVYGNKEESGKRFVSHFAQLPDSIKGRLILENDDKNYTVEEVLKIASMTGSPVVFDNLHHALNPSLAKSSEREWILECKKTWKPGDGNQKIHYSQQLKEGVKGAHSDTIRIGPFEEFYCLVPESTDIMLEVKDKNLSAIKCINTVCRNARGKQLESEWAKYKYYVLSRCANIYGEIRQLLKEKEVPLAKEFYTKIEAAMDLPENKGAEINGADHVWGYFSKDCTEAEKNKYQKLINGYRNGEINIAAVKRHLYALAKKRELTYLTDSYYFYL